MNSSSDNITLEVKNLKMYFPVTRGILHTKYGDVKAVDNISFKIKRGETLGLVGESGCGKTTTGHCVLRLYRPTEGHILFEGRDISRLARSDLRTIRRKMQLVFQDPYSSLNPRQRAGNIVGDPLKMHNMVRGRDDYRARVEVLFRTVGLNPGMADRYPHEFSGGQRQRIGIARALSCEPSFIICDEPVSALDVSIQAQIINLLQELQERLSLTFLFIAHDLSVVRHISNHIAVMYLGRIVEVTESKALFVNPLHPYTRTLLSAVPVPDPYIEEKRQRIILKGDVPSPLNPPSGCSFHPRCPEAIKECSQVVPPLRDLGDNHQVACLRV